VFILAKPLSETVQRKLKSRSVNVNLVMCDCQGWGRDVTARDRDAHLRDRDTGFTNRDETERDTQISRRDRDKMSVGLEA